MKLFEPLKRYLLSNRPFFGICLGMQSLFEGSDESPSHAGLGIIKGRVTRFSNDRDSSLRVPHIGWNGVVTVKDGALAEGLVPPFSVGLVISFIIIIGIADYWHRYNKVYFVHSFCALPSASNINWVHGVTDYGPHRFISAVKLGNVVATQFHPEKSGDTGLRILAHFLHSYCDSSVVGSLPAPAALPGSSESALTLSDLADEARFPRTQLAKRVVACLDVRSNDSGDLVVTKGDQYDVREESAEDGAAVGSKRGR